MSGNPIIEAAITNRGDSTAFDGSAELVATREDGSEPVTAFFGGDGTVDIAPNGQVPLPLNAREFWVEDALREDATKVVLWAKVDYRTAPDVSPLLRTQIEYRNVPNRKTGGPTGRWTEIRSERFREISSP